MIGHNNIGGGSHASRDGLRKMECDGIWRRPFDGQGQEKERKVLEINYINRRWGVCALFVLAFVFQDALKVM